MSSAAVAATQRRWSPRANGVVLVDTKLAGWGQPILEAVQALTSQPVSVIINTHTHGDHVGGNADFPATVEIVAHENAAARMADMDAFAGAGAEFLPDRTFGRTDDAVRGPRPDRPLPLRRGPHRRRHGGRLPGAGHRAYGRSVRLSGAALHRRRQWWQRCRVSRHARPDPRVDRRGAAGHSGPYSPATRQPDAWMDHVGRPAGVRPVQPRLSRGGTGVESGRTLGRRGGRGAGPLGPISRVQ